MTKFFSNPKAKRILFVGSIILVVVIAIFFILHGQRYFSRRELRLSIRFIRSYGVLSPLVILSLIVLSTIIPPLPLPIPLIELSSGIIFGFWEGFFIVWISQIISSFLAFYVGRSLGKRFLSKFIDNRLIGVYREYLKERGPRAVFILRLTMGAPLNAVSYLAGLSQMRMVYFFLATALGTIPEAALFSFVGSQFRSLRINLFHIFVAVIIVGAFGTISTLLMMRYIKPRT